MCRRRNKFIFTDGIIRKVLCIEKDVISFNMLLTKANENQDFEDHTHEEFNLIDSIWADQY